ncbi:MULTISPECIES: VOC family protein [unclassified Kitasatospora]|uniref:VOC family protein n=1 Tax=unclassified Kitasatospora TaxID=2633591 RepID=UPI00340F9045
MASLARHVTIDCADPHALATFWAQALDGTLGEDDNPGDEEALVESAGASLLFIRVPDGKSAKNRVHLDLQPQDRSRDEEVERLVALGATVLADRRTPDGKGWFTLADPNTPDYQFWSSPRCRPPPLPVTSGYRPPLRRA